MSPRSARELAAGLPYRDFITVGLLLRRTRRTLAGRLESMPDNWIYIQEPDVLVGRLQIFNNWSPYMVADPDTVWVGLEYFCYEGDELWKMPDDEIDRARARRARADRHHRSRDDVLDATVLRMPKTYPAYFGTYDRFDEVRAYLDRFQNLFLVGRNGMHRYNNQDHSMLTAMVAVDNIAAGQRGQGQHLERQHRAGVPRGGEGRRRARGPADGPARRGVR